MEYQLAARVQQSAMRPRRRAWLRIFVVRRGLPCDPQVGGHSCNGGMIPRFQRPSLCGRWLTEITMTERGRTDMRQNGTLLCRHSLGAGTRRRGRIREAVKLRKASGLYPPCGLQRVWPSAHNWLRPRASFVWRPDRPCSLPERALPSHGRASTLDHLDERMA